MPIRKVDGGWRWGEHGRVYPTREGAEKQARAAYSNGYTGDSEIDTTSSMSGEEGRIARQLARKQARDCNTGRFRQ